LTEAIFEVRKKQETVMGLIITDYKVTSILIGFEVNKHKYIKQAYIKEGDRGSTVVKVLCYKSEGRWLDPSWCHWNFSLT